ncbi:hypothetical protein Vau01_077840 [Virgisporangium aurantiacum]|uniref:Magnesium transporter n=1 Tax=Virgisporangium aurantiacum TaxID=175570 RepID=A0A8J4E3S9_9ACTN|nr:magnesium transporter CorA family protein [Virgisporangium aurantiacum]GIJ60268.1 hypothetical protein Vau01_077840 [Virgisporangium aurantiacum]
MKDRGQRTAVADPAATAAPNQVTVDPGAIDRDEPEQRPGSNARARTRLYRNGACVSHDVPVAAIAGHLTDPTTVVWLDLCRPTPADFAMVDTQFGLHELAIEDALQQSQRPKLDHYPTHLFLSAYAVTLDADATRVDTSEIAAFITGQALITVRHDDRSDMASVLARWDAAPDLTRHGVAFLLHGLLDHLVDGHLAAVQQLDDGIEQLDDLLFEEHRSQIQAVQRRSFQLRKNLVVVRRVVLPMRDVLSTLLRRDLTTVGEAMAPYFQDAYDHVLHQLGRDHRRPHRDHRLLRPEPPLPR